MRSPFLFMIIGLFGLLLSSCSPEHSEIVVSKFDDTEITMKEFEEAYAKNVGGIEEAKTDSLPKLQNFLDLYTNFKMKLRDASIRGFDNNESLSAELLDYQRKVGSSYILEKQVVEPAVEKLYDRRKEELRVSHLMVRATAGSNIDSLRQVAQIYLDSIKNGADYETMVKRHSDDNFSKTSGGDIFYVTGGQLPWEFEDAAYNTPKGQIYPALIQTKFGFHIIKVTDRKPRIAKIKASHILISYQDSEGKIDSAAAKLKMDTVLAKLSSGESFEEVAKQYSMDPGSKDKGGDLGFFERRMMVKEFDEAAFNLEIGQVSNVVKTNFGYHIIKCTDKQPIPPFESEKENLKKVYRQGRFNDDNNILVDSLKAKYNFQQNQQTVDFLLANSDGFHFGEEHPKKDEIGAMTLFTAAGKNFNALDVLQRIGQDKEFASKELKSEAFEPALKKISGEMLLEEDAMNLDKRDPQFASLMKDYRDGIYIFKLQEEEVWNKLSVDSTKLYNYWEENKSNYVMPDKISFSEIYSAKDSLINHYYSLLQSGENFDSLAFKYTERPGFKTKAGNYGLVDVTSSVLSREADKLKTIGEYSTPFKNGAGYSIFKLNSKEASRLKAFEEAKPEVSGTVQEMESKRLENDYISGLKNTYNPQYFYEELQKAFKQE